MRRKILFCIIILTVVFFAICIFIFYTICLLEHSNTGNNLIVQYNELDAEIDTSFFADKELYRSPFSPERYEKGVIPNAMSAATIACNYITAVYGEDCAWKEQPYQIRLINDQIWQINGCLPMNRIGGTFSIAIDKYTGRILYITHEK